jgi:hypothetical protein
MHDDLIRRLDDLTHSTQALRALLDGQARPLPGLLVCRLCVDVDEAARKLADHADRLATPQANSGAQKKGRHP